MIRQADRVIIAMGSVCDAAKETIDYMMAKGEKVGLVQSSPLQTIHKRMLSLQLFLKQLLRLPFSTEIKKMVQSENQYIWMFCTAFYRAGKQATIVGGRYGLGSKDVTPSQIISVYENLKLDAPKNNFTIGIVDDVTYICPCQFFHRLTLPEKAQQAVNSGVLVLMVLLVLTRTPSRSLVTIQICMLRHISHYDSKKSGGVTQSHLRFGKKPIRSTYLCYNS